MGNTGMLANNRYSIFLWNAGTGQSHRLHRKQRVSLWTGYAQVRFEENVLAEALRLYYMLGGSFK